MMGSLFLMNQSVSSFTETETVVLRRRYIGYVFQAFRLFRAMNALEFQDGLREAGDFDELYLHQQMLSAPIET